MVKPRTCSAVVRVMLTGTATQSCAGVMQVVGGTGAIRLSGGAVKPQPGRRSVPDVSHGV